ncbi:oligosaccharide flippase family protein [Pasteurella atlantica]|uniref:oligosaccharide flippase family protein n=1 Tax=Pasteurellaceae TaxID=712 RepID=UPI002773E7F6|nr:oligosaccharide flippase family protein [Pasteurella atlantica]MDP8032879.1 oligosaccharide flippase family protein [Pasteurella atlantica]MDP8034964.1 oligosaccharide flippase family protein [Pasteurella atlantica]MDP8036766.1 oligosaccharide flippase family protein [Pasteurella atlantica]MDP8047261.1 oligosaccharide flippase family protein [Pasteurella atlantica]MDP8049229.1 oligosaccharide flippase family protein [Pasteurella atlantica]
MNYLIPLIILPYLVRVLGHSEYGALGLSFTIVQYILLFTDFGFNLRSSRDIARNKYDIDYVNQVFSATICIKLFFSLLSIILLVFLIYGIGVFYEIRWVVFCGLVYVFGSVLTPIWLFQGLEKVVIFSVFTTVFKILTIPLVFLFVKSDSDADITIFIQGFVFLFTGVFSIFYAFKKFEISFVLVRLRYIKDTIKNSSVIFVGTIAVSLYTLSTPYSFRLDE